MIRKPMVAGNWKMHTTIEGASEYEEGILAQLNDVSQVENVKAAVP